MSQSYIACLPLLHALMFALAVLATCWLRRPVIAAMLAIFAFLLVSIGFESIPSAAKWEPIHIYNALYFDERQAMDRTNRVVQGTPLMRVDADGNQIPWSPKFDLTQHGYPIVYGSIAAMIVMASLAAWRGALRSGGFGRRGAG